MDPQVPYPSVEGMKLKTILKRVLNSLVCFCFCFFSCKFFRLIFTVCLFVYLRVCLVSLSLSHTHTYTHAHSFSAFLYVSISPSFFIRSPLYLLLQISQIERHKINHLPVRPCINNSPCHSLNKVIFKACQCTDLNQLQKPIDLLVNVSKMF